MKKTCNLAIQRLAYGPVANIDLFPLLFFSLKSPKSSTNQLSEADTLTA
jgi:hypothetical protein